MKYIVIDSNSTHIYFDDLRLALVYIKNNLQEGNFCTCYETKEIFNSGDFDIDSIVNRNTI